MKLNYNPVFSNNVFNNTPKIIQIRRDSDPYIGDYTIKNLGFSYRLANNFNTSGARSESGVTSYCSPKTRLLSSVFTNWIEILKELLRCLTLPKIKKSANNLSISDWLERSLIWLVEMLETTVRPMNFEKLVIRSSAKPRKRFLILSSSVIVWKGNTAIVIFSFLWNTLISVGSNFFNQI